MKTFKSALLGATALTAMASMSFAASSSGSNESYTAQDGNDNTLLIEQIGGNTAGANTTDLAITQNGDDNEIDIYQERTGNGNKISTGGDRTKEGVDQIGDNNKLDINQVGSNLVVYDSQQTGGAAVDSNVATIDQTGTNNYVMNIKQTFRGNASSDANEIDIQQTGQRNYIGNTVSGPRGDGSGITQFGNGNSATVDQSGSWQQVFELNQKDTKRHAGSNSATIKQMGSVGTADGNLVQKVDQFNNGVLDNTISITQTVTGDGDNGKGTFAGTSSLAVTGVQLGNQSFAGQSGSDNELTYSTVGQQNKFGFLQQGIGNMIDSVSNGTGQEVAVRQSGDDNDTFGNQAGLFHSAGVQMEGNSNFVDFTQSGSGTSIADGNRLAIMIDGNSNELTSVQTGMNNLADLDVEGNRNHIDVSQNGTGALNSMKVNIVGNDNNNFGITSAFGGDADWARDKGLVLSSNFSVLNQGDLSQDGGDNSLTLDVFANRNAFAMLQDGTGNVIVGEILSGMDNQAVVAQIGSNNTAHFSIAGMGNVTGVVQH